MFKLKTVVVIVMALESVITQEYQHRQTSSLLSSSTVSMAFMKQLLASARAPVPFLVAVTTTTTSSPTTEAPFTMSDSKEKEVMAILDQYYEEFHQDSHRGKLRAHVD